MGWQFDLKHANTVAYLTVPSQQAPPRLTAWQLREFLGSIQGEYRDRPPLFSSDQNWIHHITRVAKRASTRLNSLNLDNESLVESQQVTIILDDLRRELSHFQIYGLAVGTRNDIEALRAFAEHAAFSSRHHGLFLIPDLGDDDQLLEIFDPSPVAKKITAQPDLWPGMLFWVRTGVAAFAALDEAHRLYQELLDAMRPGKDMAGTLGKILDAFNAREDKAGVKRLLHLSDLHFGTTEALKNQAYLSAHLKTKLHDFQRIVVTGDLFDNPKENDALAFSNFRADLETTTGKDLIVIPGNHDQKFYGNSVLGVGQSLKQLVKLEWSSLVVDDDLRCVFYCFDTSANGQNFARGSITKDQTLDVAKLFEIKVVNKSELRQYLPIALIHHHPYSFEARAETMLQKGLDALGMSDEKFLRMEGSEEFLSWCAGRRVPLVLHGHKHIQRHVKDRIQWSHGKEAGWREVTAVGCGTSLGAEGMALSYNVLEWSPKSGKWSAAFFSDPGSGTGFEETYVALHAVDRES